MVRARRVELGSLHALRSRIPALGFALAAVLTISRRPDALTHAQFWAEDGRLTFADVYNHGFLRTLLVPQSGYYQALPVIVSAFARLLPLAWAPTAMNLVAIAIRALPVWLLLGGRARTISPDLRVRVLLASLYIALPGLPEADANIDNALWYLAVAAVIVLMLDPPSRRRWRVLDGGILLMCAVTGVFSIVLAPLALLYRRWHPDRVPSSSLAILGAGAALQIASLLVLQHHIPAGFNERPRISVPLGATPELFLRILGGRVVLASLLGNSLAFGRLVALAAGIAGVMLGVLAFRRAGAQLRLFLGFAALQFAMALASPQGISWHQLTISSDSGRYFIIPGLAVAATVVWAAIAVDARGLKWGAIALLLFAALAIIPSEWVYTPNEQVSFASQVKAFEHSRPGARVLFSISPWPWTMTLVRR